MNCFTLTISHFSGTNCVFCRRSRTWNSVSNIKMYVFLIHSRAIIYRTRILRCSRFPFRSRFRPYIIAQEYDIVEARILFPYCEMSRRDDTPNSVPYCAEIFITQRLSDLCCSMPKVRNFSRYCIFLDIAGAIIRATFLEWKSCRHHHPEISLLLSHPPRRETASTFATGAHHSVLDRSCFRRSGTILGLRETFWR